MSEPFGAPGGFAPPSAPSASPPAGSVTGGSLEDDLLRLARDVREQATSNDERDQADAILQRLSGPLRVAVAGRVKAGKSTLINALVGERVAATDAGECTRLVSWYQRADGYGVNARLRDGSVSSLGFRRLDGALDVELGGLDEASIERIEVGWPSSSLASITLIDTPGLASIDDANSRRTRDFLEFDADRPSDADAVIYLIRHAHRSDVAFLDAFLDRSVVAASPVNAVAVLSRADEIGAGRLDAMSSARRIALRYVEDPQLRGLCSSVVPVAGLLAETGLTLREDEAASLRLLASTDDGTLAEMLLSADQFCDLSASELTVEVRRDLLHRLGMFGVRLAVQEISTGRASSATSLGATFVEHSGLADLRTLLSRHFAPRARVLQARSAIAALRAQSRRLAATMPTFAQHLAQEIERLEAGSAQFAQVRAAHLVASGAVALDDGQRLELDRLFAGLPPSGALGLSPSATDEQIRNTALEGIARWRTMAGDPLADPMSIEVCEVAARTLERIFTTA